MTDNQFILAARTGRNQLWRYLATFLLVAFLVQVGTIIPQYLVLADQADSQLIVGFTDRVSPPILLALKIFPFVFVPLGLWIGLSLLHQRAFLSLLNVDWSFHWRRCFLSAGLWLFLLVVGDLFMFWHFPTRYVYTFSPEKFFTFLAVAVVLIPIMAAGEEMLFRGYLTQGFGLLGGFWIAWLAPAVLFVLLRYQSGLGLLQMLPYFGMGLLLGWLTLRSLGLELAIGLQVMHNLYGTVLVKTQTSDLPASALFSVRPPSAVVSTGLSAQTDTLIAGVIPVEVLVFFFIAVLYLALIHLLGHDFFPRGLFWVKPPRFNRLTQPRGMNSLIGLLGLFTVLAASGCVQVGGPPASGAEAPALVLEDCLLQAPGQQQIEAKCGTLRVYEDPAAASGEQIELYITVLSSISREPASDPVVMLAGGPGQAATEAFLPLLPSLDRVRFNRELVMVDQRGTGKSNPLRCPELEESGEVLGVELPLEKELELIQSCRDHLGIDPLLYTTEIAAQDLDQVRQSLGYNQLNLLGVSYGTRAALVYQRMFPDRVRTLVLDGVVPPNWVLGSAVASDAQRALDLIFDRCNSDPACREEFPSLAEDFDELMTSLSQEPVEVSIPHPISGNPVLVRLSDTVIGLTVRLMSYSDLTAALLPLGIRSAAEGDYTLLASLYVQVAGNLSEGINMGMYYSVLCSEDAPLLPKESADDQFFFQSHFEDTHAYCQIWLPDAPPPPPTRPQTWDTPALLISGEVDPVTPPANGEELSAWLPNSKHIVLEGKGHSNFHVGCMPDLLLRFFDQASINDLDTSCTAVIQPMPFFLSPVGPQP
jgi:pimeloyl-ACP methyl ester carboxylesterase/membrane protease YdiL (CAAX protease family)